MEPLSMKILSALFLSLRKYRVSKDKSKDRKVQSHRLIVESITLRLMHTFHPMTLFDPFSNVTKNV